MLGILACGGALPVQLAEAYPEAQVYSLKGIPHLLGARVQEHQVEKLGGLFLAMQGAGVSQVVLAGGLARPEMNPADMDAATLAIAPRLIQALKGGDDQVLRQVIEMFEEQGFTVIGAHDLLPDLCADLGLSIGPALSEENLIDATRGMDILNALSPLDIGQGCVVAHGQALGIETIQGTDALLSFVAQTRPNSGGVFVKAAKRGQDLRVDMPAIGPDTVEAVAAAGLAGIVIEAERVMILDSQSTFEAVQDAGLFLTARVM